jgi:FkbM family methyltransferase
MKQLILNILHRAGYSVVRYPDPVSPRIDVLGLVLEHVASSTPDFFFIQIGANDGVTDDPIHKYVLKYHWRGILVEPQPDVFRTLVANYGGEPQLLFENVAIAPEDGVVSLFTPDYPASESGGVQGVRRNHAQTSFNKGHVISRLGNDGRIKELKVPAVSVSTLISKHSISKIDLLQIDAEGYDYDIIRMFDFNKLKPTIINFDSLCLNGPRRRECWKYLADWGYRLLTDGAMDTLAFLQEE